MPQIPLRKTDKRLADVLRRLLERLGVVNTDAALSVSDLIRCATGYLNATAYDPGLTTPIPWIDDDIPF